MKNKRPISSFVRLFTVFARPYALRLTIGVLAGVLAGVSLLGVFTVLPSVIRILQGEVTLDRILGEAGVHAAPSVAVETEVSPPGDEPAPSEEPAPERSVALQGITAAAQRLGITVEEDGRISFQLVCLLTGAMLGCFLFRGTAHFLNRYLLRWVGARVITDLRNALFDSLQKQSLAFYGRQDAGRLISRCTYDTGTVEHAISSTVADLCRAPVEILVPFGFILSVAVKAGLWKLMVFMLPTFPLLLVPVIILSRLVKRYAKRSLQRISDLVSRMQENFTGIRVVKAFNMERAESARFHEESEHYFRVVIRALAAEIFMAPVMQLVAIGLACLFMVLCYREQVGLDVLGTVAFAAMTAYRPIKELAKINVSIQRSAAAADRIFEILDTDTSLPVRPDGIKPDEFRDSIVFDGVSFAYDADGTPVIRDLQLNIPKGSVVAFVGETGSGKTTVANLLARFYDPTEGRILFDGHDLRDLDMDSLRSFIGIVTQDTILFNDTIGNNIRYGSPSADNEAIIRAAKQANAHEFILEDELGYDRPVGEKGCLLSGGQRQRIAIARAILKNPPILILDEATSALDTATEQLVQEAINHVMEDRTVFAIAHRLSTIKHADLILVLEKGVVIERGSHEELYARNGKYRSLCDMQFA